MISKLLPILGITFIDIVGFSMLLPILPFFAQHFGASDVTIGILFGTFSACQFFAGPLWGYVSDRVGRKMVLIVSQIGSTIGWLMLAFAHALPTVFAARILEGASGGNLSVTQAYVADLVEPERRPRAFSYVYAAFGAGMVLGPLFGWLLLQRFGFSAPFLAAAAFQLVTLVLTVVMLPESRSRDPEAKVVTFADIGRSLTDRRVSPIMLQSWAISLGLYAWFGVFALLLQTDLGFGPAQNSLFMVAFALVSFPMQAFAVGPIYEALGDRMGSNIGIACLVVAFAMVPFIHSIPSAIPTLVLFAGGMSIARPGITSLLTRLAPSNQRGAILGSASSLDSLSGVLMPPVSTGLLQSFGSGWAGVPSLFFSSLALVMGLFAQRRETRAPVGEAPPAN